MEINNTMEYTKIIQDDRGTIKIIVTLVTFSYGGTDINGNHFRYDVRVYHTPKGKRKEVINDSIANEMEIYQAKAELYLLLIPPYPYEYVATLPGKGFIKETSF